MTRQQDLQITLCHVFCLVIRNKEGYINTTQRHKHFLCLFCFLLNFLRLLSSLGGSCRVSLVPYPYVGPLSLVSCVMSRSTVVCPALLSCVYPLNVLSYVPCSCRVSHLYSSFALSPQTQNCSRWRSHMSWCVLPCLVLSCHVLSYLSGLVVFCRVLKLFDVMRRQSHVLKLFDMKRRNSCVLLMRVFAAIPPPSPHPNPNP